VDPATNIIYETEDRTQSGFYRFVPDGAVRRGQRPNLVKGRLQMLAVKDRFQLDTATGQAPGVEMEVQWVDLKEPNPTSDLSLYNAVFLQGWAQGGARFSRGEGCWYENGAVYFACTNAGDVSRGQIWGHQPNANGGTLKLIYESPDASVLNFPDNICSTPKGGLVICEDADDAYCLIRGLTPRGEIFDFARNIANDSEFAGATFSPDGQTLFVNIQAVGQTVAIWGPWDTGPF
jgi:secreted PhoX family phosphatase